MIKLADIPGTVKFAAFCVGTAFAVVGWMSMTFETASAAEQKWSQHNMAITCRSVYELEEKIRSYIERIRFDSGLTDQGREWLRQEIANLQAKIKRLDPGGVC